MGHAFEKIMRGLEEVKAYKEGTKNLRTTQIAIEPVPSWQAEEIKQLRLRLMISQRIFSVVLGVSKKTVEAWESGKNSPNGPASRLMELISKDSDLLNRQNILSHV